MKEKWGLVDSQPVYLYTLKSKSGIVVKISNYGGIIQSFLVPDRNGNLGDIVLGYDSVDQYVANSPYFGAIVGRYANRIKHGQFRIDDKTYKLATNNGNNALHGGLKGFDKVIWEGQLIKDSTKTSLILTYHSKDGEEGYPGNLSVKVIYILTNEGIFKTIIEGETDKPTPINLCNHSYFNLRCGLGSILNHTLQLNSDKFTVVNDELIPTGELRSVKNSPMDFTISHAIGERIEQVPGAAPGGYDHNYVLRASNAEPHLVAILKEPESGRSLTVYSTQPGVQFYSGNFLDGTITGKGGIVYTKHWGLCLETQHFPDSPNQATFPNTILHPGEKYCEKTIWEFNK